MLELQNISYMVDDDDKEILRDINLAFDEKFVVITGPNGSGKNSIFTTVLQALSDQTEVESPLLQRLSPAS